MIWGFGIIWRIAFIGSEGGGLGSGVLLSRKSAHIE